MKDRICSAWMPLAAGLLMSLAFDPTAARGQALPSQPPVPPGSRPTTAPNVTVPSPAPSGAPARAPGAPATSPILEPGSLVAPEPGTAGAQPGNGTTEAPATAEALATHLQLKRAPLEDTDVRFPINLATALRLADARPLIVAAAQAGVWVAEAELTRAKVLWIPTLNIGFDYLRHDGGGPDFNKGFMTAPSVNFFYGGAGMWGPISFTDVYFQPLVQRQVLNARHWDIQAAKNDALMQTADAYFRVHQYRGMYAGALYTVERGKDLVDRIEHLSRELVPLVEVDRARNMLADLDQAATSARQEWRVASADLTQVLRLDPRAVVEPLEHDHAQVTLVDPGRSLDDLMPVALTNRPELSSYQALVQATMEQIRREKWRPLLPTLYINGFQTPNEMIQAGVFGIGPNDKMNQWRGRVDLSYQPLWQLEAFGIGNMARIKEQRGNESAAIIDFWKKQDQVAGDVTRAVARVQSAAARILQADRALRTAIITFNGNFEGLRHTTRLGDVLVLVNRPQEAVFALQLLNVAFNEYFSTVSDYNRAQFELFHALGYPASEVALVHPPGPLEPVNVARPPYLPPVGNGPPPATR